MTPNPSPGSGTARPACVLGRKDSYIMKKHHKKLLLEMVVIVLIGVAAGIAFNFRLLRDAATGTFSRTEAGPVIAAADGASMNPAPLAQARELLERNEAIIIDAREGSAFSEGHIKGALSLPIGEFESRLKSFRATTPVHSQLVIYCSGYGCRDSYMLGEKLIAHGYGRILIYEGGYPEWKDAGLPIEGAAP